MTISQYQNILLKLKRDLIKQGNKYLLIIMNSERFITHNQKT